VVTRELLGYCVFRVVARFWVVARELLRYCVFSVFARWVVSRVLCIWGVCLIWCSGWLLESF